MNRLLLIIVVAVLAAALLVTYSPPPRWCIPDSIGRAALEEEVRAHTVAIRWRSPDDARSTETDIRLSLLAECG